ncbi:MAG TPA: peptide ABC transporter substrate-binding protein [Candidatus Limnocylindrales bacterium]|nr:peptide ABC transporter substrate-binding protein [Candidatus Limnocylindrales bacterium]
MRTLFATLALGLLVTSCTAAPGVSVRPPEAWKTDTELITAISSDPDIVDPQLSAFLSEAAIVGMLYEPLLSWDPVTLALVPAAARELPAVSADGRVYTYALRPGLTYSDGSPLTARRFVDAFARLCDPRVEYAFVALPIAGCEAVVNSDLVRSTPAERESARAALGVRAVDDVRLEFTLTKPFAAFPQTTALWVGSPVRQEDLGPAPESVYLPARLTRIVGNGPFTLKEWIKGDRLVFERNERYRLPVRLAKWTKRIVPDLDTQRVMYDAGRIDLFPVAPRDAADREALVTRSDLNRTLGSCTQYVGFNTARPPFDDANARLAFAKALDKEEYARSVNLTGRAAASLVIHAQPGHAHDDRVQQFDPAEARRLLASSKYGAPVDGKIAGIDLRFPFQNVPRIKEQVDWIVQQWYANLGVRVTPEIMQGWGGGLVKKPQPEPQVYRLGWCEDYPDGQNWYQQFASAAPLNRTHQSDPAFDLAVATADVDREPFRRQALYEQASRILSASAAGAWLTWSETWWLVRPEINGYELSSFDWDFAQFSLARIVGVKR